MGDGYSLLIGIIVIIMSYGVARGVTYYINRGLEKKQPIKNFSWIKTSLFLLIIFIGFTGAIRIIDVQYKFVYSVVLSIIVFLSWLIFLFWLNEYFSRKEAVIDSGIEQAKSTHPARMCKRFTMIVLTIIAFTLAMDFWYIDIPNAVKSFIMLIRSHRFLMAVAEFVIFFILSKTILYLFKTYINNLIRRKEKPYESRILKKVEYPISWVIIFMGLNMALKEMYFGETIFIPIVNTAIIVTIMHATNNVIDDLIEYWEKKWHMHAEAKIDDEIFLIAHNASKVIIVIISVLAILIVWGFSDELRTLILSLSVMGVVLGFALKNTFANIIGGISLMMDHTYKTHDVIKLDTGEVGEVVKIGLRSTKIRSYDNEIITIPNSVLSNTKVYNYAQPDNSIRIKLPVSVEYGTDPDKVRKVLLNCLKRKRFISNPELNDVWFVKMNDFSIDFELIFYISDYNQKFKIRTEMMSLVYKELKKNRIRIPFPTRTLYMKNDTG